MLHIIQCPNCKTGQLFQYGQTEIICQFEKCNKHVIKIEYTVQLLKQIIEKLQQITTPLKNESRWTGIRLQKFPNGSYVVVPQ